MQSLNNKLQEIEVQTKTSELRFAEQKNRIENPIELLLAVARGYYYKQTNQGLGDDSHAACLWDEEDLNLIRGMILDKIKNL